MTPAPEAKRCAGPFQHLTSAHPPRFWSPQASGRIEQALQRPVALLESRSPFRDAEGDEHDGAAGSQVWAFEIEWGGVQGVDYRCPLIDPGRLVLESRHLVKRCFKKVKAPRNVPLFPPAFAPGLAYPACVCDATAC